MADLTLAWLGLGVTAVLLAFSAFFSSAEMAIFSLPVERDGEPATTDERPATGDRPANGQRPATDDGRAAVLARLRGNPHRLLVTVLVGNNVVNVAISSVVSVVLATYVSAGVAVVLGTVLVSVTVLVFGEIVPKSYGLANAADWSLTVARPIALVERVLGPLVWLFEAVTRRLTVLVGGEVHIEDPYLD